MFDELWRGKEVELCLLLSVTMFYLFRTTNCFMYQDRSVGLSMHCPAGAVLTGDGLNSASSSASMSSCK